MKCLTFSFAILFLTALVGAQSTETKKLLDEIATEWKLDENKNVTYTSVIEVPNTTKDVLFDRAMVYISAKYQTGEDAIESEDKQIGQILARGTFGVLHTGTLGLYTQDCWGYYVLRLDFKDNRARITLSATDYKVRTGSNEMVYKIAGMYPADPKGVYKNYYGTAFYSFHMKAQEAMKKLEGVLKGDDDANSDDW